MNGVDCLVPIQYWCLVLWTWQLTLMSKAWVATSLNTFATSLNLKTLLYPLTWQPPGPLIISGGSPLCDPHHCGPASSHIDVDIDVFQLGACCNCNCCNVLKVWVATSFNTLTTLLVRREPTLSSRPPWTCLQLSQRSTEGSPWDSDRRLCFDCCLDFNTKRS